MYFEVPSLMHSSFSQPDGITASSLEINSMMKYIFEEFYVNLQSLKVNALVQSHEQAM